MVGMRALNTAVTGMQAQQLNIDVIANNVANANTTGYKRRRAEFEDLFYQDLRRVGTASTDANTIIPSGVQVGLGVLPGAVYPIHEMGALTQTSHPLDVAVQGKGFFRILTPDGEARYTRAGNFQPNAEGQIVTEQGLVVSPGLTIPQGTQEITINQSGEVYATLQGQLAPELVGQLDIATFVNEAGLAAIGDNLYQETVASGPETVGVAGVNGVGTIRQGFLERSNADPIVELTAMIEAQRVYEMNSKVIQAADRMMQITANTATG